jgi:AcrR family transcriptional regulator
MEKKKQNLNEAEQLFKKYGFKSITMDDVSRHLGISKKTLYQYVENKADLIEKIMHNHNANEMELIAQIQENSTDAIDELFNIAVMARQQLKELSPAAIFDLKKYYKPIFDMLISMHQEYIYNCIKNNLDRGIKNGLYRDDLNVDIIARLYMAQTLGLIDDSYFPSDKYKKERVYSEFIRYHFNAITTKKGATILNRKLNKITLG